MREIEGGESIQVIAEPEGKNTAPALLYALKWLEEQGDEEELFLVAPTDHLFSDEKGFLQKVEVGKRLAQEGDIVLFGVTPTHPHPGYGYLVCEPKLEVSSVTRFIEKPPEQVAKRLLESNLCLWNVGIILFQKETFLSQVRDHRPDIFNAYEEGAFDKLPPLSIDHAFLEVFTRLKGILLPLSWTDVGTWDGIYEAADKDLKGNVTIGNVVDHQSRGCLVISDKREIVTIDLEDLLIIDTDDGLLITKRGSSQKVGLLQKQFSKTRT